MLGIFAPQPVTSSRRSPNPELLASDPNYQPPTDLLGNALDIYFLSNVLEEKTPQKEEIANDE